MNAVHILDGFPLGVRCQLDVKGMAARFMRSVLILLSILVLTVSAHAEKKIALVIGNEAYEHLAELRNNGHDALAVSNAFERLGFTVVLIRNANASTLRSRLAQFAVAAGDADVAAVYVAGHGIQVNGETFVIPTDARLKNIVVVGFELISLDSIMSTMQWTSGLKLFFLDMCGHNAFKQIMNSNKTAQTTGCGLSSMDPGAGTIVSYAGKAGTGAEDRVGEGSPYAAALLKYMEQPGLDLMRMFRNVRNDVMQRTDNRQEPFFLGTLPNGKHYLLSAPQTASIEPGPSERDEAARAWNLIQDTSDRDVVEAYLHEFGDSSKFYALLAGRRLADLAVKAEHRVSDAESAAPQLSTAVKRGTTTSAAEMPATAVHKPEPIRGIGNPQLDARSVVEVSRALSRSIQAELNRIGCSAGTPDGVWGKKSQNAVRSYMKNGATAFASLEPNETLLAKLRGEPAGICPLHCSQNQVPENGRCVAKTCPVGQSLSSTGKCRAAKTAKSVAPCTIAPRRNSIGECVSSNIKLSKAADPQIEPKPAQRRQIRSNKENSFKHKGVTGYTPGFCYQSARNLC